MEDPIRRAARLILTSHRTVALTGAGISTPSDIPDYRSPGSGLWEKMNPIAMASASAFSADPLRFYQAFSPVAAKLLAAKPNAAHLALADLETWGLLACIITQNVDNLHQKAGSRCVWEIHGHLREATCIGCRRILACDSLLERYVGDGQIPRCPYCGQVLKPNVVLFGDPLPRWVFMEVTGEVDRCDLMLVIGSSLEVAPASDLPFWALRHGARIIVVNDVPTPVDSEAAVVIRGRVEEALPALASACRQLIAAQPSLLSARTHGDYTVVLALPRLLQLKVSAGRFRANLAAQSMTRLASLDKMRAEVTRKTAARIAAISQFGSRVADQPRLMFARAQGAAARLRTALTFPWSRDASICKNGTGGNKKE